MTRLNLIHGFLAVALLAVISCGDDGPTGGGGTDDTVPPSISTVTPVDEYHVDVTFSEKVTDDSAERWSNYLITETAAPLSGRHPAAVAPGDTIYDFAPALQPDDRTVTITTAFSMSGLNFNLRVLGVSDLNGNEIISAVNKTFAGSSAADVTPPQIVDRFPAPNSTNAPIATFVRIQFSEPISYSPSSFAWTSPTGPVAFTVDWEGPTTRLLIPNERLEKNALQTISVTGVTDPANNAMPDVQWSFKTTNVADTTPPTLVSSSPANLATNVSVDTDIRLTFSEAMDPFQLQLDMAPFINMFPAFSWSEDSKTVTLTFPGPFTDNQQFTLIITRAADLSGNFLKGIVTRVFTTGASLETGSIAGVVTGDAGSAAADPAGALVLAEGDSLLSVGSVAGNRNYGLTHVGDDTYEVLAMLDTDHDGEYNFYYGDAIGAYGFDINNPGGDPDSVIIFNGTHATGINFPIYDLSAITGTATYDGVHADESWTTYSGLFTTDNFDPDNPVAIAFGYAYGDEREWLFNSLVDGFPDGDYYVGAFIDVNDDGYFPGFDPVGFYGGAQSPTVIHVANGSDAHNIVIPILDPAVASAPAPGVAWGVTRRNPNAIRLFNRAQEAQKRLQSQPLLTGTTR